MRQCNSHSGHDYCGGNITPGRCPPGCNSHPDAGKGRVYCGRVKSPNHSAHHVDRWRHDARVSTLVRMPHPYPNCFVLPMPCWSCEIVCQDSSRRQHHEFVCRSATVNTDAQAICIANPGGSSPQIRRYSASRLFEGSTPCRRSLRSISAYRFDQYCNSSRRSSDLS